MAVPQIGQRIQTKLEFEIGDACQSNMATSAYSVKTLDVLDTPN